MIYYEMEEECITIKDHIIYCYACDVDYVGSCSQHSLPWFPDKYHTCEHRVSSKYGALERIYQENLSTKLQCECDLNSGHHLAATVPDILRVSDSKMVTGELGVWSRCNISKGTILGPVMGCVFETGYQDKLIHERAIQGNGWFIRRSIADLTDRILDYENDFSATWTKLVKCTTNPKVQNVLAIQYSGLIYFRVCEDVFPDTELLLSYGGIQHERDVEMTKGIVFPDLMKLADSPQQICPGHSERHLVAVSHSSPIPILTPSPHVSIDQSVIYPNGSYGQTISSSHAPISQPDFDPHALIGQLDIVPNGPSALHAPIDQPDLDPNGSIGKTSIAPHVPICQPYLDPNGPIGQTISAPHAPISQPDIDTNEYIDQPVTSPLNLIVSHAVESAPANLQYIQCLSPLLVSSVLQSLTNTTTSAATSLMPPPASTNKALSTPKKVARKRRITPRGSKSLSPTNQENQPPHSSAEVLSPQQMQYTPQSHTVAFSQAPACASRLPIEQTITAPTSIAPLEFATVLEEPEISTYVELVCRLEPFLSLTNIVTLLQAKFVARCQLLSPDQLGAYITARELRYRRSQLWLDPQDTAIDCIVSVFNEDSHTDGPAIQTRLQLHCPYIGPPLDVALIEDVIKANFSERQVDRIDPDVRAFIRQHRRAQARSIADIKIAMQQRFPTRKMVNGVAIHEVLHSGPSSAPVAVTSDLDNGFNGNHQLCPLETMIMKVETENALRFISEKD